MKSKTKITTSSNAFYNHLHYFKMTFTYDKNKNNKKCNECNKKMLMWYEYAEKTGLDGIINLPLFSTVVPSSIFMFLSCRPFVVITTLSTGLVGVEVPSVSWLGQLTVGVYISTFLDTSFLCSCKIMRVFFHYFSCFCFCWM